MICSWKLTIFIYFHIEKKEDYKRKATRMKFAGNGRHPINSIHHDCMSKFKFGIFGGCRCDKSSHVARLETMMAILFEGREIDIPARQIIVSDERQNA